MSNISVNTKWGVPRYDGLYESEVYSLDGQDLVLKVTDSLDNIEYTNAHRKENISRNQGSLDRKSTRLNSSYVANSYAVFCLKRKKKRRIVQIEGIQLQTEVEETKKL